MRLRLITLTVVLGLLASFVGGGSPWPH